MATKALGHHYREGIPLVDLFRMFPDDATAEAFFADERWPGGVACPHCGSVSVQSGAAHKTMPYRCRDCRKRFSVKTGTVMESSNLGYQTWALASYLLTTNLKGVSSMKLHRDLGITQKSAWHLAHRLREAWDDEGEEFTGPVEVDETYVGGQGGQQAREQAPPRWPWSSRQGCRRWRQRLCHRPRERGSGRGGGWGPPSSRSCSLASLRRPRCSPTTTARIGASRTTKP